MDYYLTTPQQNIWNLQKYFENTSISNICGAIFYNELCDSSLLKKAINKTIELQAGLRLCFKEENGVPIQYVADYSPIDFDVVKFDSQADFDKFAVEYALVPIDMIESQGHCFTIFELCGKSGVIVRTSHLVSDAWSYSLFAKSVSDYYNAFVEGKEITDEAFNYTDYIEAEQKYFASTRFENDASYWHEKYNDKPELSPIKTASLPGSAPTAERYSMILSSEQTTAIDDYCDKNKVSQAVLFEAAIFAYLSRINNENKSVTIGIPVLNRSNSKEKSIVGMFISTTPLTVPVSQDDTAALLCEKITDEHRTIFRHQKYPYSHILNYVRENHDFTGNLYDVMVSYQNAKTETGAKTKWYSNGFSEVPFAFHIDNRDSIDSYTLTIDYQNELFRQKGEIPLLVNRILLIIEQIIENDSVTIGELNIIPENEYELVINKFNDTAIDYPRDKCVHELFSEQAAKSPDKIALVFEDKKFTYKQLDEMSNSLAHYLREKGVKPNDVVPIIAKRSWHIIVAMLGVLKAGGAYMPVDPAYPLSRIVSMIADAKSDIAAIFDYDSELTVETIKLDDFDYSYNSNDILTCNQANDSFCILHTSGTTGKPKCADLTHQNMCNFIESNAFLAKDIEQTIAINTITFDVFEMDSIYTLCMGLTVILTNDSQRFNQSDFEELVYQYNNSLLWATPTNITRFLDNSKDEDFFKKISVYIVGGEIVKPELIERIKKINSNVKIYTVYGPTETLIYSTMKHLPDVVDINLGKPIANTQIYILDSNRKSLPIGVAGELCISGDGVGKGYLNRPELTAEKFIPNPFIEGKTMYCTGDLARWREDGEIEYLGRIDTQVKIRGLRIELGEIESVMSRFDGIHMTAVTDKRDENNRQYLVGYYTADSEIDEKALRQYLAAKLPKYMVPNYFVHLTEMPMTATGKTDRKVLPLPDFSIKTEEYIEPVTETEKTLAGLYAELLKIDKISRTDNFFDIGGDSLMAIALLNKISNAFGVEISMGEIIEYPVVESLAGIIDKTNKKNAVIKAVNASRYELLPQQKAIYAVCSKNPEALTYNMPTRIDIPDSFDRKKIKKCFKTLIEAHRSLKTYITADKDNIYGVYDKNAEIVFEEYSDDNYSKFIRPFDLAKAPLIRIAFTETTMLFDMHHIIGDGEALNIILHDLAVLYNDRDIMPSDREYSDYAEYFYNADFSGHKEYFKNMLKCDFEPVVLPEKKHHTEACGVSKIYNISKNDFDNAKRFAQENDLTDTMVFLGAFGILLSKFTAKPDILSSVVLTNRTHKETQNIVGMFVNTLPVAMSVTGSTTDYYAAIKEMVLNLFEYQELPFFEIAEAVNMSDKTAVNTSFVYQADGVKKLDIGNQNFTPEFIDTHTAKFDVSFELTPHSNGCMVRIEYNCGKYEEEFIDRLFKGYDMILKQLDTEKVADISLLDDEEYNKVIYEFNDTAVKYHQDKCVHELFSEQAAKTPDKIALVFEDKQFTYKQLDEMSNSLAHYLREKGVKPNDVVPIIAIRSWHIIVAMLGVLKAGGAYMPVDPEYPNDRIEYMLETSSSALALTYGYVSELEINSVDLSCFDYNMNITDIDNVNSAEDLCYVIFTSGSTGKPKGVALCHRNVANYCNNNDNNVCHKIIRDNYNSIASVTNIIFDIFVTESILPLLNGITIYYANDVQVFSQSKLSKLISHNNIDVIQITPTKMRSYILDKENTAYLSALKVIILGGEALPTDLYLELKQYTDAEIYNIYGPAETTVWSTNKKVEDIDITIGKPIANTQIYILDSNRKPLPIGVAGELCISGDGVGKGYLNRPELTAEKFIPNPFIEGKTMYCTGDLARWREDGEIEYLGRIDTQVKIRGLRIELGEIESVMSSFDGINMTAVTDKRDENNRQYLVGYYTADTAIDEKALRRHLSAKLPKYMVPNYFVHLSEMPMTASGKTDRKNLPLPDFTAVQSEYIAPETEKEKKLCEVVQKLFGIEQVGVTDDFFDIGGDSLKAIEYVAKAHNVGVNFALQDVFDYPTIRQLCKFIDNGAEKSALYTVADFEKYNDILSKNVIDESFVPQKKPLGNVLLTGATGFLGAHILDNLMQNETGKIYCLVRSNSPDDRRGRWVQLLNYYFGDKYDSEIGKRIIPIIGDIVNKNLSDDIPYDVQTVIHTAATVKHYGSYEYFRSVNVEGTRNVVNYAKRVNAKLIHISTLSVSGNSLADQFDVYRSNEEKQFFESSLFIGQPLENVYIRSKFEAEMAVLDAMLEGLDAKIIRVGNLTNRESDSKFQPNYESNAFLTRFKAAVELGMFPDYLLPLYAEFSPIDKTADGVVKIAQYADKQNVFHLNSNRPIYFDKLLEVFGQLGIKMEIVSGERFNQVLQKIAKDSNTEYIYEAFQNDMGEDGKLVYDSNIRIINNFTDWFMRKLGFEWTQTGFEYIKDYVEYFRSIEYLEV